MRDIVGEIRRMQPEMNRMLGSYRLLPNLSDEYIDIRESLTNLKETNENMIELHGVEKEAIQLTVTDRRLEVMVEKRDDVSVEDEDVIREERIYRTFYRAIGLPSRIIPNQVQATYKRRTQSNPCQKAKTPKKDEQNTVEIK
ncbi:MAG: Hsp20/alpha crystallin family protein [Candidatus Aenigmarchaeota archaeon]|nr:Hsp20/alpha crystallin family protein [Candidatus Aenigmarchaeota archaeon]